MRSKSVVLALVVVLATFAATPAAASPLASPCVAGGGYNPACDVNQDGSVNILDVQLTAGHWNQTGTFTSDNNHNHLAQTWTGTNNPLTIQGSYSSPYWAPLILSNSGGVGLRVNAAGGSGVWVESAGNNGVLVDAASNDGLFVCHTGTASGCSPNAANNGVEIGNAQHSGLLVDSAGYSGVDIESVGADGVFVNSAAGMGVFVQYAGDNGVYANTTRASGQYGFYTPDAIHGSNVLIQSLSLVAQVAGPDSLTPGDIVAAAGVTDPVPGSTVHTPMVRLAGGTFTNVVGVVESRMALTQKPSHTPTAEGETRTETPPNELRSVDGPAQAGDYVAIIVLGAAQVKVQADEAIQAGQRLTIADTPGRARAQRTVQVEGVKVDESGPTLGAALEAAEKDGMVWVLVNPQ